MDVPKKQINRHFTLLRSNKEFLDWASDQRCRAELIGTDQFPPPATYPCFASTVVSSWGYEREYPVYYHKDEFNHFIWRLKMESTNYAKIERGVYLVRTAAGIKHALRDYFGDEPFEKRDVFGYPKSYPSVLFLAGDPSGRSVCVITAIHVNKILSVIKDA